MTAVTIELNGVKIADDVEPRQSLVDFLRDRCGLTATHIGCEHGACGACTVLCDGRSARACLMLAVQAHGHDVTTVESLAESADRLHPLQQAFSDNHGLQCGFCTPGMVMSAVDLLKNKKKPSEHEIREWLEGNLCRCTGYHNIVKAIQAAAETMAG